MNGYAIEFASSIEGELRRLPAKVVARARAAIGALGDEPRPRNSKKLQGAEDTYRIRVGRYRVVYKIYDERRVVVITRVRHRKDAYE